MPAWLSFTDVRGAGWPLLEFYRPLMFCHSTKCEESGDLQHHVGIPRQRIVIGLAATADGIRQRTQGILAG